MTNELNISLGQTGQTVMGRVYSGGAQVGSDISLAEVVGQGGYYTGNMPAVAAGYYDVQFFANSILRGSGNIAWNGTGEVNVSTTMQASSYSAPPSAAAIRTEMDANSTKLANLDAAVSSRLPTSGYTAPPTPPTVVAIRTEMDNNSTKLANLDATVSSRLATSGYMSPTSPPTVVAIRTEMDNNSTKLANLDATVSSRLAASGYMAAPSVIQVRQELDANSTKLANLDVAVSSRLATSGYTSPTSPPTVVAIRTEMDNNSTKLTNLDATISSRLASTTYVSAPTVVQVRQELDANSIKLAGAATSAGVVAASNAILSAVGSTLQASSYVIPPSAASIAATTAAVLFVDGTANSLKVNPDHSVNNSVGSVTIANYITVPAAVAVASQDPAVVTCLRGDTLRISLPLMGDLTSRTKLVMTAKSNVNDADSQAVLQVVEGTGLTRLNGSIPLDASAANLVVTNASTGATSLVINANITSELAIRDLIWDAQAILSTGIVSPIRGTLSVIADVTQSVT